MPAELERRGERVEDLLRHDRGVVRPREVGDHDGELVAAQARHGVVPAHAVLEPAADLRQQLVADLVAERVVHQLEAVQVHEQHPRAAVAAARLRDRLLEPLLQQVAVRQPGDGVEAAPAARAFPRRSCAR